MRPSFTAGAVDTAPFSVTVGVLGVIFGAGATSVGLGGPAAVGMSVLVFSGSAQFAILELWGQDVGVLLLTTMLLNSRFLLMGTSLATRLPQATRWQRALLAFAVTDESYALSLSRGMAGTQVAVAYLAGSTIALYLPWVAGTAVGVVWGGLVPAAWAENLSLVFPLVFLVLTVLSASTGAKMLVAVIAAASAVPLAVFLPPGWHVVLAGALAAMLGPTLARWLKRGGRG